MLKKIFAPILLTLAVLSLLLLAACGETPTATTAPTTAAATTAAKTTTVAATTLAPTTAAMTTVANAAPTAGQTLLATSPAIIKKVDGDSVNLTVELARTSSEQQTGLMGRTSLADDTGMLFIFPAPTTGGFWMRNTLIPLSIAFIDQQGLILNIQDMQPQSDEVHAPGQPYVKALEVPQGYFAKKGIKVGDRFLLVS